MVGSLLTWGVGTSMHVLSDLGIQPCLRMVVNSEARGLRKAAKVGIKWYRWTHGGRMMSRRRG